MNYFESCFYTLLRSLIVVALVMPVSSWQLSFVANGRGSTTTRLGWVLIPFVVPELLIGYAYSSFWLSLIHIGWANHALYVMLLAFKLAPIATAVRYLSPPSEVSASAIHCHRLLRPESASDSRWTARQNRLVRRRAIDEFGISSCIVFLLAFQEFEIASLLSIPTWTVHLFDAQSQGLLPVESFKRVLLPVAIELLVVVPLLNRWLRTGLRLNIDSQPSRPGEHRSSYRRTLESASTIVGSLTLLGLPVFVIASSGLPGLLDFIHNTQSVKSYTTVFVTGLIMAAAAALVAWFLARRLLRSIATRKSSHRQRLLLLAVCVPGLAGTLPIGIGGIVLLQLPVVNRLASTPIPSLIAFVLFLLPRAILLLAVVETIRHQQPGHFLATSILRSRRTSRFPSSVALLNWITRVSPQFWVLVVLFWWAFNNLTVSSLLNPPNIVPLAARLYNFMHYGQNGPLSIVAIASVVVPILLVLVSLWSFRWMSRRRFTAKAFD